MDLGLVTPEKDRQFRTVILGMIYRYGKVWF